MNNNDDNSSIQGCIGCFGWILWMFMSGLVFVVNQSLWIVVVILFITTGFSYNLSTNNPNNYFFKICLACCSWSVWIFLGWLTFQINNNLWIVVAILFLIAIILEGIKSSSQSNSSNQNISTTSPGVPDDINNILIDILQNDIKDPVTQERFMPGQTIYLCHIHRLVYHQDSWEEIDCKCLNCGNGNHTKIYKLPQTINLSQDISKSIDFRDIN